VRWGLLQDGLLWRVSTWAQAFAAPLARAIAHRYSLGIPSLDTRRCAVGCPPSCQLLESTFGFFFAKLVNLSHSLGPSQPLDHGCREPSITTFIAMLDSRDHFRLWFFIRVHSYPAWNRQEGGMLEGKAMGQLWFLAVTTLAMQDEGRRLCGRMELLGPGSAWGGDVGSSTIIL